MAKYTIEDAFADDLHENRRKSNTTTVARKNLKQKRNLKVTESDPGSEVFIDLADVLGVGVSINNVDLNITPIGRVMATHRGRYIIDFMGHILTAARKKILLHTPIVPGDFVKLNINSKEQINPSIVYRIERVYERSTLLERTADDSKTDTKAIAANVDYVAIITSTCTPNLQPEFLRRVTVANSNAGIKTCIIWTKTDLLSVSEAISRLEEGDIFTINQILDKDYISFDANTELEKITNHFYQYNTALVGLSGAGKSTLINRIFPDANREVGDISINGDGRHTSSSSQGFKYGDKLVIDTPGIRSFGLGHIL